MTKRIRQCPVCNQTLEIREYYCSDCDVTVRGKFEQSELSGLTPAQQEFVKTFICAQGSIKEVEKRLKISYPTVKSRLAEIIEVLGEKPVKQSKSDLLDDLANGQISVEDVIKRLS
jgi:hypothetical protein